MTIETVDRQSILGRRTGVEGGARREREYQG